MAERKPVSTRPAADLPCAGDESFSKSSPLGKCMHACMNCRREVESSLTRVAGRKLRKLRSLPSCAVSNCVAFLMSIADEEIRLHLSSMAWWRFSSDSPDGSAERLRRIMVACRATMPEFGKDYMHRVLRILSPLSQEQLSAWFGNDNLYQIVALFTGERPVQIGKHCTKCKLYKQGCTEYGSIGADECPFWADPFVQAVAAAVAKAGDWRNPCSGIDDQEKEEAK